MKKFYKSIITCLILIMTEQLSAQTFEYFITNDRLVSSTQYEMDIYIISTSVDFNLRTVQNCIIFNPAFIPAGSAIVASYVVGSTQLVSFNVGAFVWSSTGFGFQVGSNIGVTCATGTIITSAIPVRIGTFRLVSSMPFNCSPSMPTMVLQGDPAPVGLALRMSITKWNSTDCSVITNSTITNNGTFSRFPNSAYSQVNNMLPVITSQPVAALNCSGSGFATFSITATNAPGVSSSISYQWFENGMPVSNGSTPNGVYSGATSSSLTITNPGALLNANVYSCAVTQCNADTSFSVSLTVSNSDDNNVCTIDACDPVTGAITHTPVNMDDGNVCTTDACDPVSGVFHTAVNTNDNNACTTDGCNVTSGVFHTPVNTNDNNICTTDACDTVSGNITHNAVNTNDNNACTTDGCDPVNGVFHTPVAISDNDPCTLDACDTLTGTITHIDNTPQAPVVSVLNNCGYSTLTASSINGSFLWNTNDTTTSITVTSAGTYTVSSIVNGCTGLSGNGIAAPFVVPVVSLGNDTGVAFGNNLILDAGAGFTNYLWSTTETTQSISISLITGIYFVSVIDSNGCTANDTIVITFYTGINDPVTGDLFQLYPNPVKNSLFIQSNGSERIDLIMVYNSLGQSIALDYFLNDKGDVIEINTLSLSAGVYSVEIISGKNKFIKMLAKQ